MDNKLTKEELDVIRHISLYNILGLTNDGRLQKIKCPSHNGGNERTPSFTIYPEGSFHCFGCGINGQNAIDLLMELGYGFQEALEELVKYI